MAFSRRWRSFNVFLPLLAALAATLALWLLTSLPAQAQCGTKSSSCRNCHEVKGQLKVNAKGDWHVNHAFGDFCAACHAGDVRATDKDASHLGMMKPLDNVTAACITCHPDNAKTLADRYAKTLGVAAQMGAGAATPPTPAGGQATPTPAPSALPVASTAGSLPAGTVAVGGVIDFSLPEGSGQEINVGNLILVAMLVGMVALWAGLAGYSWIGAARKRVAAASAQKPAPSLSPAVGRLIPALARCDEETLRALQTLLDQGGLGSQVLVAASRLKPEWLEVARKADPSDLALAIALARST